MPTPARCVRLVLLALMLIVPLGCTLFRRAPMQVPPDFQPLTDPATRADDYKKLFPPLPILKTGAGDITASGGLSGKQALRFTYLGVDEGNLRLNTYIQTDSIFDVIVHAGTMTVVFYKVNQGIVFEGPLGDGPSPFGKLFGVEPGDLLPIFKIGQIVANESFTAKGSGGRTLIPGEVSDKGGLRKIELDKQTGLPRTAMWRRPIAHHWWSLRRSACWDVTYLRWDTFKDGRLPEEPARLMPRAFKIVSSRPRITLRVELPNAPDADPPQSGYRYSTTLPGTVFNTEFGKFPHYPLGRLEEFLKQ